MCNPCVGSIFTFLSIFSLCITQIPQVNCCLIFPNQTQIIDRLLTQNLICPIPMAELNQKCNIYHVQVCSGGPQTYLAKSSWAYCVGVPQQLLSLLRVNSPGLQYLRPPHLIFFIISLVDLCDSRVIVFCPPFFSLANLLVFCGQWITSVSKGVCRTYWTMNEGGWMSGWDLRWVCWWAGVLFISIFVWVV